MVVVMVVVVVVAILGRVSAKCWTTTDPAQANAAGENCLEGWERAAAVVVPVVVSVVVLMQRTLG